MPATGSRVMIELLCKHLNRVEAQSAIGVDRVKQIGAFQISVGVRLKPRATKMQALAEVIGELHKFNLYVESLDQEGRDFFTLTLSSLGIPKL